MPLRSPHADAQLDLKAIVDQVYDSAGYQDYAYRNPPASALSAEDTAWAAGLAG